MSDTEFLNLQLDENLYLAPQLKKLCNQCNLLITDLTYLLRDNKVSKDEIVRGQLNTLMSSLHTTIECIEEWTDEKMVY